MKQVVMVGHRIAPSVLALLICVHWLSAAQGVELLVDPAEQGANDLEEPSFTWERLLNNSLSVQEFRNASGAYQDFTQVQHFLSSFGKALDLCNTKIEESADVARHLIRRYMENVIAKKNFDRPADDVAPINDVIEDIVVEEELVNDRPADDAAPINDVIEDIVVEEELVNVPDVVNSDPIVPTGQDLWGSLNEVLDTLREACDDLPIVIVESDIEAQRHTESKVETVLEQIIRAMSGWTKEWSNKISILSSAFIDSCVQSTTCERNLKMIVDVFTKSLEETKQSNHDNNHGLNVRSIIGSSSFWDHMNNYTNLNKNHSSAGNDRNFVNSVLVSKLQKMAGIFGHFAGAPDSDNEEYINASGAGDSRGGPTTNIDVALLDDSAFQQVEPLDQSSDEMKDNLRMQRMVAAAVNVIRFPWQDQEPSRAVVTIVGGSPLREVPPTFLSLALESQLLRASNGQLDTRSTKLRKMMAHLSPAVLRLGGSSANFLTFDPEESDDSRTGPISEGQLLSRDVIRSDQTEVSLAEMTSYQRSTINNVHSRSYPFAANFHKGGNLNRYQYTTSNKSYQVPKSHPKFRQVQTESKSFGLAGEEVKSPQIGRAVYHPKYVNSQPKYNQGSRHGIPRQSIPSITINGQAAKQVGVGALLPPPYRANAPRPLAQSNPSLETSTRSRRSISSTHPKFMKHTNRLDPWDYDSSRQESRRCFGEPHFPNYTVTEGEFNDLLELCERLNWTLLFDLNQFTRDAEGGWDPTNARQIIAAAQKSTADVIWQVGNEPNNYAHKFQFNISGAGMADDVRRLRSEVQGASVWQRLKEQLGLAYDNKVHVVGPDVTRPQLQLSGNDMLDGVGQDPDGARKDSVQFLEDFLSLGPGLVDAIAWHQYYVCGRTATTSQFTSPDVMEFFTRQLRTVRDVRNRLAPSTPIWMTETGSAYGGGAPGLSNRFAGSFLWLDKLGVAARDGVDVVARQSLYGGHYAMLDASFDPNPDYWVSVLHKLLVGGRVLNTSLTGAPNTLRLYAHCIKEGHPLYQAGGAVFFGLNTASDLAEVALEGPAGEGGMGLQFLLTPALGDLTARDVLLNGIPLSISDDGDLPPMMPAHAPGDKISIPGNSLGFWLFPASNLAACL